MFKLIKNGLFLAFVFLLGSLSITLASKEKTSEYPELITTEPSGLYTVYF